MKKISVIVPVYNTEKYLNECINSLLNQTIDDYEIIVINDCSKGNEDEIINNYKDKKISSDHAISLIKENVRYLDKDLINKYNDFSFVRKKLDM